MPIPVDQCKNFDGIRVCRKCGRALPDVCLDQSEIEQKARAYDEMVAAQSAKVPDEELADLLADVSPAPTPLTEAIETEAAPTPAVTPKVPLPGRRKGS